MWISILEIGRELKNRAVVENNDCSVLRNQIQKVFPGIIQRVRLPETKSGAKDGKMWAVPVEYKEQILREFQSGTIDPVSQRLYLGKKDKIGWEQRCAEELKAEGFVTIITREKGLPDVLAFRKRPNGGFDLVFREAKGPGDGVRKEQHEMLARLTAEGVDAGVRFF